MRMETNGHHHNVSNGNLPEDHAKDDDLEDEEILAEDNEWNQFDEIIGCIEDIPHFPGTDPLGSSLLSLTSSQAECP